MYLFFKLIYIMVLDRGDLTAVEFNENGRPIAYYSPSENQIYLTKRAAEMIDSDPNVKTDEDHCDAAKKLADEILMKQLVK